MRIYHVSPEISVAYLDDIHVKVNVFYTFGRMVVQQPKYLGGRKEYALDEYDNFDGNIRAFVLHKRGDML